MTVKRKPSCLELDAYLRAGKSLTDIHNITGYSVPYLSKLCKGCGLEVPKVGRKKGYIMDEDTKRKIGEANRK